MGRRKKNTKTFGTDLTGGILVVLGLIIVAFLTFSNTGIVAKYVKDLIKGLFSYVGYIIPITLIYVGMKLIASDEKKKSSSEIMKGLVATISLSAMIAAFTAKSFNIFYDFTKYISDSYSDGIVGNNLAGSVGMTISAIFTSVFGKIVARIILVFIALVSILYFLNISLRQLYYGIYNVFAFLANGVSSILATLFRKDEFEDVDPKPSRAERRAQARQQAQLNQKLKEKGNKDADKNVKPNDANQLEFDLDKLTAPTPEADKAKQQRDDFFKKQKEQKVDKDVKEVLTLDHTKLSEEKNYLFPPIELLGKVESKSSGPDKRAIQRIAIKLQKTLASFGVDAKVTNITRGPTVTRYELTPNIGVKVSRIVNLADDIALNLAAKSIRIEAPIPGRAAVGIEVPNPDKENVYLREIIESDKFVESKSKISFGVGKDVAGEIVVGDIGKMPHVLIAGATGAGKSVCINSLIVSLLYKAKPSEVKLILIDPKMVELSGYNGLPHLLIPVVTDPRKAAGALNWAVQEMVNRYKLFATHGVKDIKGYNQIIENELDGAKLPQIVIIIDELSDLMMVAPKDVEDAICRLAQMARAAGMHLVVATQRPSVDVVTGIIKANIPSRIAFTTSSQIDSRTILDMAGAEKLLGKGDMLYYPVGANKPIRIQGAYIDEGNIEEIVEFIKSNSTSTYNDDIIESIEKSAAGDVKSNEENQGDGKDADELLEEAIDLAINMGQASASMFQRKFKIGYSRAGRLIDQMEARGLISGYDGSKPRKILISKEEWQNLKMSGNDQDVKTDVKEVEESGNKTT